MQAPVQPKWQKILGWGLTALSALAMLASAGMKLSGSKEVVDGFVHFGFKPEHITAIGAVELVSALLFLVPRVSFLGAILLIAYLGGATSTHVRVDEPFFVPIIIGVVVWMGYGLRNPEVIFSAFRSRKT